MDRPCRRSYYRPSSCRHGERTCRSPWPHSAGILVSYISWLFQFMRHVCDGCLRYQSDVQRVTRHVLHLEVKNSSATRCNLCAHMGQQSMCLRCYRAWSGGDSDEGPIEIVCWTAQVLSQAKVQLDSRALQRAPQRGPQRGF